MKKKIIRKIIHKNNIKKITIITGQQKSGKSLITKLVTTLEGPINIKIDFGLDNLIQLVKNNFISISQFKDIFLLIIDNIFINSTLGRNLNLKKREESSIWSTSNPQFYLKKIKQEIGKKKLNSMIKKEDDFFITLHNFLEFKEILSKNIPKIKIIYVYNNPINQIYNLYESKKFVSAGEKIDRSIMYTFNKKMIFNDVYGYEKKYLKSSRLGKLLLLKNIYDQSDLHYLKKRIKNIKVLKLNYDDLLSNPHNTTVKISKFLGKKMSNITRKFLYSKEIKLRKKSSNERNIIKNKKLLISKIKNKKELHLFKRALNNFHKFK